MSILPPKYSVIIPTYNRAKNLALTLGSVCNQTLPIEKYEIIVVDDGSTDNTKEVVLDFQKKHPQSNIHYFYEQNGGPAKARNLGIKESKGEIIFFTDDDCVVPPNWMATLLDGYRRHPDVAGVGGWREVTSRKTGFIEKCESAIDKKFGAGILNAEIKTNLYFFPYISAEPANLSYKKSILKECGGFDENLRSDRRTAKEFNIKALARGHLFLHLPLTVKRIKKYGLKDLFYQYSAEGRDLFYLYKKYPKLIKDGYGNFLNIFVGLLAYFEISHFYTAYFFSTLFSAGGRNFAKYWEQPEVEEAGLLPNENFEISQCLTGEKKIIKTSGRPFSKSVFIINKPVTDFCSIVIPTYNRADGLIRALENLVSQTISPDFYEIIIINDGSTDDTETQVARLRQGSRLAKAYGEARVGGQAKPEIKYFKTDNGGPAKARNFGIEKARGKFVFFTDDDCTTPKDWMETLLAGFKKYPDAAGVGGWIWPPEGELLKSAISRLIHFEGFFKHPIAGSYIRSHEILSNDPLICFGSFAYNTANVCYKKEVLKATGGFQENFYWPGSEDMDLAFRIIKAGYSMLYLPFHVIHPKSMALSEFVKLYFRRGANGYLMKVIHREFLEKLKPGSVNDYGSMANFIYNFSGPEKFLALIQWLSINAGVRYMKNKLTERDKSGSESSASR